MLSPSFDSLVVMGSLICVAVLASVSIAVLYSRYKRKPLAREYHREMTQLATTLNATLSTRQRLLANEGGVVLGTPAYKANSKLVHDESRAAWATWLATCEAAQSRYNLAESLYRAFQNQRFFDLRLNNLRKAIEVLKDLPVSISGDDLPESVREQLKLLVRHSTMSNHLVAQAIHNSHKDVVAALDLFRDAFKAAALAQKAIDEEFNGVNGNTHDSVAGLKEQLAAVQLPIDPYDRKLVDIAELRQELDNDINTDPLTPFDEKEKALRRKIGNLKRTLKNAVQNKKEWSEANDRFQRINDRIQVMRAAPVQSGLPEVTFTSPYRLDEPGYEIDVRLSPCKQQLDEAISLLVSAHLIKFSRVYPKVVQTIDELETCLDQICSDKERVDSLETTICNESTTADLAADAEIHSSVRELYGLQRWNHARMLLEGFKQKHELRLTARGKVKDLICELETLRTAMDANREISSNDLDEAFLVVCQEVSELETQAQHGAADWHSLIAAIAPASERVGERSACLQKELQAHQAAVAALSKVVEKLTDLKSKLGDKWGGKAAADELEEAETAVTKLVTTAGESKPNWGTVHALADQTLARVEKPLRIIYEEIERWQELGERIAQLSHQIQVISAEKYARACCGVTYGKGLYCLIGNCPAKLKQIEAAHAQRNYTEVQEQLSKLKDELYHAHLETWWLTLQTMAHSLDPCARKFASDEGYADTMFKSWAAQKLRSGSLYQPPSSVPAHRHDNRQNASKKPSWDAPSVQDYRACPSAA